MPFQAPENLSQLTEAAIATLRAQAQAQYDTLLASGGPDGAALTRDNVTDEQMVELEALQSFQTDAVAEINDRAARASRFEAATAAPEPVTEPVVEPVTEPVVTAAAPVEQVVAPSIADVAGSSPTPVVVPEPVEPRDPFAWNYGTLTASAGLNSHAAGSVMNLVDAARILVDVNSRFESLAASATPGQVAQPIGQVRRTYPDDRRVNGSENDYNVLMAAANERNLPGGSLRASRQAARQRSIDNGTVPEGMALTAAGGWCAPSETLYTTCFQTTNDGMFDVPEVQASRGGIRHNTGLDWSTVYGGGNILAAATGVTGFFNLTEAQVQAGSPVKTNIQVACPSFTDTRLGVTGTWITSPILTNRAYPEFVATFMEGASAVHQHQLNALAIQAVVNGSTAVTLNQDPYVSDGTFTSNILAAVEMAIVDTRYRLRLQRNANLEVVLPFWALAQIRADLSRRTGMDLDAVSASDAQIDAWFATRGASVQFPYDWQDAFTSSTAGLPGAATPIQNLPFTTQFLVYPTGTWVKAVQDVITLNAIYDSALLPTNVVTQLFLEDGWAMLQMCPISRVYTVPTCPSGATTSTQQVDCVTP